jgi:hypothetical protein
VWFSVGQYGEEVVYATVYNGTTIAAAKKGRCVIVGQNACLAGPFLSAGKGALRYSVSKWLSFPQSMLGVLFTAHYTSFAVYAINMLSAFR